MAELPSANVTIDDEAGALATGTDLLTVIAPVGTNADGVPRVFSSTKALLSQHNYAPGVDYCAMHFEETKKPVLFIGVPIVTAGTIGRQNAAGVTGSSVITVAAGGSGVLEETDGVITVLTGGTIGTSQIVFSLSLDGGTTSKRVRLGTAVSYTVPYVGLVINFAAGTLVAGDVYTFETTAPRGDTAGLTAARTALAAQSKQSRSWLIVSECQTDQDADDIVTEVNAYETANDRDVYARAQVLDRLPRATMAHVTKVMTGSPTLTFHEVGGTGDTITRSAGSFISEGFAVGDIITVAGSVSNNVTGPIASLSATVITLGTTDLADERPVSNCTLTASMGLTFAEVGVTGDTITRSSGSWLDDGFRVGDSITVAGSASNNVTGAIAAVTASVITFGTTDLAAEVVSASGVTIATGLTMSGWVSLMDSTFAPVDGEKRIDLGLGRGRKASPIHGAQLRRPVQWAASLREYQHDVQIPCWRKADGKCKGWDLQDSNSNTVEYDERLTGGALAARFTCFRSYANGPAGAFIALSLTRASENSLLSRAHNMAVADVACQVTRAETENAIGQVLELNDDGTGEEASLTLIEERVNTALAIALLQRKLEGPRASSAKWVASRTDVLNIPGAELTGTLDLRINGTLEKISTRVRVL